MVELLKQKQFSPLKTEEQVASIYAGVKGYLDKIEVSQVQAFETGLLGLLHSKHDDVLSGIAKEKALTPELEEKLKSALDGFAKTFAA